MYAGSDIRNDAGNVVVEKDTLIEKVTTGSNGSASYKADLPIGNSYYIKELQAPEDYYINSEEEYSFTFRYTTDDQASVSFTHTFENERVDKANDKLIISVIKCKQKSSSNFNLLYDS